MAQPAKETHQEIEMVQEEKENDDRNTSFLPVLNLLIVFLSSISSSEEERLNYQEFERKSGEDNEANKACISELQSKRQKINGVKLMRRTPRMQTTVRDSRYNFNVFR
jgi:hypothetical protein